MENDEIVKKIKNIRWDHRVTRTGFLQSKVIVVEAEMQPVIILDDIVAQYKNQLWVNDYNLYDEERTESFLALFDKAFRIDTLWPRKIIKNLEESTTDKDVFENKVQGDFSKDFLTNLFNEYCVILYGIQKFYVIAVPLTNYCEKKLKLSGVDPTPFAVSYIKLDVDRHLDSLRFIQNSELKKRQILIDNHLKKFAWIKTAYNIIDPYTPKDVSEELSRELTHAQEKSIFPKGYEYLAEALQVGIYMRNRMKELSQQIWFAFEPVALAMAEHLKITRDDFLMLTSEEVNRAMTTGNVGISSEDFKLRKECFVTGFMDGVFVLLTGNDAKELLSFYTPKSKGVKEFKGQIACKGIVKGKVCLVSGKDDFTKFKQGEILVTSMTTPDFVVLMKKARAIITNEGGLSSHAAIVSRELNVPCIIGTKVATQVLKDGDMVEVDADKGIVKIL